MGDTNLERHTLECFKQLPRGTRHRGKLAEERRDNQAAVEMHRGLLGISPPPALEPSESEEVTATS